MGSSTESRPNRLRLFARKLASYLSPQRIQRLATLHHPVLHVVLERGRLRLDGEHVNHSFGSLHLVFAEAFRRVKLAEREPRSVLLLGLGAGSVIHILRRELGVAAPITAVELDSAVIEIAREHFDLGQHAAVEVVCADALSFVESCRENFDLIAVDLFIDNQIPEHVRTPRFLAALGQRLEPGGLLLYNQIANTPSAHAESQHYADVCRQTLGPTEALFVRTNLVLAHERARSPRAGSRGEQSARG